MLPEVNVSGHILSPLFGPVRPHTFTSFSTGKQPGSVKHQPCSNATHSIAALAKQGMHDMAVYLFLQRSPGRFAEVV